MKTMRFSTLVKKHGPVRRADTLTDAEWALAIERGCFATVYHASKDTITPVLALVGRHGCVNAICKIAWESPLPPDVEEIVGLRNNEAAWRICQER